MHQPTPFNLTELDRQLLAMRDEDYIEHTWEDLQNIIGETDPSIPRYFSRLLFLFSSPILLFPSSPHN